VLDVAVHWIAAGCSTHALALEIQRSAARVADLVAAVKRFTYMDSRTGSEETVVDSGLRDTIRVLSSKAKARGVTVRLDVEPDLPPVRANGDELNQVWMNLIDNALDAAPSGGSVVVDVRREVDHLAVRVTDDGPGIPADLVDRIFDPFFTTKPPGQGTGLGLEITRRLVRQFHGEIMVDARPGRTTFCVCLPVADLRTPAPPVQA
jgi:signal transduction histidine kinase